MLNPLHCASDINKSIYGSPSSTLKRIWDVVGGGSLCVCCMSQGHRLALQVKAAL